MSTSAPSSPPPLKKRSVVSNFIFKLDDTPTGKLQVALFRRSDKVSTYQHHIAPISGSIDPSDASPIAAAWRELQEETTLTPENLTLFRQGKPYTFADESVGREWKIHPFAFKLNSPEDEARITIDWEHESWSWFDPQTVSDSEDFGGVPKLLESLRRVWWEIDLGEEAGSILQKGCDQLKGDTQSGARQMAGNALAVLHEVVGVLEVRDGNEGKQKFWRSIRTAAWHLWKNGRESMGAAVMAALLRVLVGIEPLLHHQSHLGTAVGEIINQTLQAQKLTSLDIMMNLCEYIDTTFPDRGASPLKIVTLSESSTITEALIHLGETSKYPLDIRILESRPLFEGVSLASHLAKTLPPGPSSSDGVSRHTITIHTDASSALAAKNADILLLGADRISAQGSVLNKTGSLPAVLSAKHVTSGAVKILILADIEKIAPPGREEDHVAEEGGTKQMTAAWEGEFNSERVRNAAISWNKGQTTTTPPLAKLTTRNITFEWVPPELIDAYITERGETTVEYIARRSEGLAREEKRLFGDL